MIGPEKETIDDMIDQEKEIIDEMNDLNIENSKIKTVNLDVGYNNNIIVNDVNISISSGEIVTIIGPNGAGKTTILKSIINQLKPIGGMIYIDSNELCSVDSNALAKKMSVVLTDRPRTELMTVRDVVETGRYPYTGRFGVLSEDDNRAVLDAMKISDVETIADLGFDQISDGQKQRVLLARAICQEPEIIVLDEPTSYLDIRYKLEFLTILQNMARERKIAVLMSLHELDLAERISDKVICVKNGVIDRFGQNDEIFTDNYIEKLYGLDSGKYNRFTGSIELKSPEGTVETFVIAGCGTGTPLFRKLQRKGIPFAAGIIYENDIDFPTVSALTKTVISVKPFAEIDENTIQGAKNCINMCKTVYCTLDFSVPELKNSPLKELYDYALDRKLIKEYSI